MAIEFRCEQCGKLLSVDAEPESRVKCPYCKAKVVVPAGLASLPTPQVPGGPPPAYAASGQKVFAGPFVLEKRSPRPTGPARFP